MHLAARRFLPRRIEGGTKRISPPAQEEAILRFADQTRDYLHEIRKRIAEAAPPGADDEEEIAFAVAHRQRGTVWPAQKTALCACVRPSRDGDRCVYEGDQKMNDFLGSTCAERGRQKRRATSEDKEKYVPTAGLLGRHNAFRRCIKRMIHYGSRKRVSRAKPLLMCNSMARCFGICRDKAL
jgi:hypothetical protein